VYRIETTPEFDQDLSDLDLAIVQRVTRKVEWLAEHPEAFRFPLRLGDYRVLLWVDREGKVLTLYGVRHRREIYDLLR
jgi:mRNA-degrading endonuclease RelE of RelBE toxin-antitoxin system